MPRLVDRFLLHGCTLASVLLLAAPGHAAWPLARHDAQRTAAAAGTSNLSAPVPYWRRFQGGQLGQSQFLAVNVEGNSSNAAVYISAGRVVASRASDGTILWQTPALGLSYLLAATDLDGDKKPDIVAQTTNQVYVLAAATGAVEWVESPTDMGTIGDVRVADLNGNGLADVLIEECGCCAVNSGKTGFVYDFSAGYSNVTPLWTLPTASCSGGGKTTVIIDPTGTGTLDVTLGSLTAISMFDGASGAPLGSSVTLPSLAMRSSCLPKNVDGMAGDELVCVFDSTDSTAGAGHQVFVLKYMAGGTPALATLWSNPVGATDGAVVFGPGVADDLDGDGKTEITVSGVTAGSPTVVVLDAVTGTTLASLPGHSVVGSVALETKTSEILITSSAGTLYGWAFNRASTPPLSQHWSLSGKQPLLYQDPATATLDTLSSAFVATDFNGDGLVDFVTSTPAGSGSKLEANSGANQTLKVVASFARSDNASTAWIEPPMDRSYPQMVTFWTGGLLFTHDSAMAPTYAPGTSVGGYYARGGWGGLPQVPVVGPLGAQGDSVLVLDSAGNLARLDASGASLAVPPIPKWTLAGAMAPTIVAGLDGTAPGVACVTIAQPVAVPPAESVTVLHANGALKWSMPSPAPVFEDIVPAHLSAGGTPDLVFQWGYVSDDLVQTRGLSGLDGSKLWDATPIGPGPNRNPAGFGITDWNGDGIDDVVFQEYGTRVISGVDGTGLATGGPGDAYFMPLIASLSGTASGADVVLQGGQTPAQAFGHDLAATLFTPSDTVDSFPYGALATCSMLPPRLVEGSLGIPSRLRITDLSGPTAGTATDLFLAGGKVFPDLASATASGLHLGQLSSSSVHANLTGKGRPTAVVGSDDGYLYAIDPCGKALDFAVALGAPVGAVVFGDTDGDGLDEILASVADGYVYDLKEPPIGAPSFVWDIDPPHGITNHEVSTIVTTDTLYGLWGAVTGASSYEIAIVSGNPPAYVSSPAWQDAGTATTGQVTNLPLKAGQKYYFAVRAKVGAGVSPDVLSPGVVIESTDAGDGGREGGSAEGGVDASADSGHDASMEDASDAGGGSEPGGGGCGCRVVPQEPSSGLLALTAASIALFVRRRRSRGPVATTSSR